MFGTPGMVLGAVEKYGRGRVEAGARGEISTSLLLELLLRIPGVAVYHGLQFPGNDDADVDHALSSGTPFTCCIPSATSGENTNGAPAERRISSSVRTGIDEEHQTGCTSLPTVTKGCWAHKSKSSLWFSFTAESTSWVPKCFLRRCAYAHR